jgi:hypothetical protein
MKKTKWAAPALPVISEVSPAALYLTLRRRITDASTVDELVRWCTLVDVGKTVQQHALEVAIILHPVVAFERRHRLAKMSGYAFKRLVESTAASQT